MLYLPPRYAHDGVAEGECMTWSVGFRAPAADELAAELLQRLAQDAQESDGSALYRDAGQEALSHPGEVPAAMHHFAQQAVQRILRDPQALQRALGEYLSEPKAQVWFASGQSCGLQGGVRLDARTRMLYDARRIFINGESFDASGSDARWMRVLCDVRALGPREVRKLTAEAKALLQEWGEAGWLHDC
jgi:50S ribosomal protein L16 3-hydroxylase